MIIVSDRKIQNGFPPPCYIRQDQGDVPCSFFLPIMCVNENTLPKIVVPPHRTTSSSFNTLRKIFTMRSSLAIFLGLLFQAAPSVRAQTRQDLLLVTRYANLTAGAESFFCEGGCRGSEADGCVATRDFIVSGQCLAEDDGVWVRYLQTADFGLCVTEYSDAACTIIRSENCGLDNKCVDGWVQYDVFEDHCIESTSPSGEFIHTFVYATTHRSMTNCTSADPPTVEDLRLGSAQVCVATNIPLSDGSYGPGSLISACHPDQSHVVTFYSDSSCGTQDGVLATSYVRPIDQCTPGLTPETQDRFYSVNCGKPLVFCKMPTGNSHISQGHGSGLGSGAAVDSRLGISFWGTLSTTMIVLIATWHL
jgi:hypothetical protein